VVFVKGVKQRQSRNSKIRNKMVHWLQSKKWDRIYKWKGFLVLSWCLLVSWSWSPSPVTEQSNLCAASVGVGGRHHRCRHLGGFVDARTVFINQNYATFLVQNEILLNENLEFKSVNSTALIGVEIRVTNCSLGGSSNITLHANLSSESQFIVEQNSFNEGGLQFAPTTFFYATTFVIQSNIKNSTLLGPGSFVQFAYSTFGDGTRILFYNNTASVTQASGGSGADSASFLIGFRYCRFFASSASGVNVLQYVMNTFRVTGAPNKRYVSTIFYLQTALESVDILYQNNLIDDRNANTVDYVYALLYLRSPITNSHAVQYMNNQLTTNGRDNVFSIYYGSSPITNVSMVQYLNTTITTTATSSSSVSIYYLSSPITNVSMVQYLNTTIITTGGGAGNSFSIRYYSSPITHVAVLAYGNNEFRNMGGATVTNSARVGVTSYYRCNRVNGVDTNPLVVLTPGDVTIGNCTTCDLNVDCFPGAATQVTDTSAPHQCVCTCQNAVDFHGPSCVPTLLFDLLKFQPLAWDYGFAVMDVKRGRPSSTLTAWHLSHSRTPTATSTSSVGDESSPTMSLTAEATISATKTHWATASRTQQLPTATETSFTATKNFVSPANVTSPAPSLATNASTIGNITNITSPRKKLLYSEILPEVAADVVTSTSAGAVAIGSTALMTSMSTASARVGSLAGIALCEFVDDGIDARPSYVEQPLAFLSIGSSPFSHYSGAILGNTIVRLILIGVGFSLTVAKGATSMKWYKWVACIGFMLNNYFVGSNTSIAVMLIGAAASSVTDKAIAVLVLVVDGVIFVVMGKIIWQSVHHATITALHTTAPDGSRGTVKVQLNNVVETSTYVEKWGCVLDGLRSMDLSVRCYFLVEYGMAWLMGALEGYRPSEGYCTGVAVVMAVLCLMYLGYVSLVRPLHSKLERVLVVFFGVLQLAMSIAAVLTLRKVDGAFRFFGWCQLALSCAFILSAVVLAGWKWTIIQRRKVRDREDHDGDSGAALVVPRLPTGVQTGGGPSTMMASGQLGSPSNVAGTPQGLQQQGAHSTVDQYNPLDGTQ